jgi:hypothetical protein
MIIQGQSVAQAVASARVPAGNPNLMILPLGEVGVSELMPRLYAMGWSGKIYSAANQAAQAVSVALATAYTGLGLYNPIGSGVNLVPLKVKFALSVAPAGIATLGLLAAWAAGAGGTAAGAVTAFTTALAVQNGIIGNTGAGVARPVSSATIATPTWVEQLEDGFTAAALPAPTQPMYMDGHLIVAPGGFLGIGALTAVTGLGSLFWAELPI